MYIFGWLSVGRTDLGLTDVLSKVQCSLSDTRGHCLHLREEESDRLRMEWNTSAYCILHSMFSLLFKEIVCEACNEKCIKHATRSQTQV